MSAYFNAYTKYLTATLGSYPTTFGKKLVTCWVRWETGKAHTYAGWALQLASAAGASPATAVKLGKAGSTGYPVGSLLYGSTSTSTKSTLIASNTWVLLASYSDGGSGVYPPAYLYVDSATAETAGAATTGNTSVNLPYLTLGNGVALGDYTDWCGWLAEAAVWTPSSKAEAESIITELLTKTPDAVTTASPIWYAPMLDSVTATVGTSLTNNGTTTFDSGVHPTLSGPTSSQFAYPISDISAGTWTPSTGQSLYGVLDETTADDADYITCSNVGAFEVRLTSLSQPVAGTCTLRYKAYSSSGNSLAMALVDGTTVRQTWNHTPPAATTTLYEQTITDPSAIVDWTNLRVRGTSS